MGDYDVSEGRGVVRGKGRAVRCDVTKARLVG